LAANTTNVTRQPILYKIMFEDAMGNDFEDVWVLMSSVFLANSYMFLLEDTRNPAVEHQRINWEEHRDIQIRRGHFRGMYRMSPEAFQTLTEMLRSSLEVNKTKAYARSEAGPILPKIRLHCLIRYLAGGSFLDICALVSMSHSTFYYSLRKTMDAINDCDALTFVFPSSDEELLLMEALCVLKLLVVNLIAQRGRVPLEDLRRTPCRWWCSTALRSLSCYK
jgi:hypothetical protein